MDRPQFHDPQPVVQITADESLAADYRREIARYTDLLQPPCPPMSRRWFREDRARLYGKLRGLRKRGIN